jgi:hypothetical protein
VAWLSRLVGKSEDQAHNIVCFIICADTVRTVEGYADCLVLRHYDSGSCYQATTVAKKPIISAGDGPGQHPTQVCQKPTKSSHFCCTTAACLQFVLVARIL